MTETLSHPVLQVPAPKSVSLQYVYRRYTSDESFESDMSKRHVLLTGSLALPDTGDVTATLYDRWSIEAMQELGVNLQGESILTEGMEEHDVFPTSIVSLKRDVRASSRAMESALEEWLDSRELKGDSHELFTELTGKTLRGTSIEEGTLQASVSFDSSRVALSELLDDPVRKDLSRVGQVSWRVVSVDSGNAARVFARVGVVIQAWRAPLWDSGAEWIAEEPVLVTMSSPSGNWSVRLPALHGWEYRYAVRGVHLLSVLARSSNQVGRILALSPAQDLTTRTILPREEVPPTPTNLQAKWDHEARALLMSWCLPYDPKNVVSGFQLFSRRSLDEPYRLLREWSWNDNEVLWTREGKETPPQHLIRTGFTVDWYDHAFKPEVGQTTYYAMAATTVHGRSSPYSMQISVRWVNATEGVAVGLVSRAGAPKPYPNLLLETRAAKRAGIANDVVTLNGRGKVLVHFAPEVSALLNADGGFLRDYKQAALAIACVEHNTLGVDKVLIKPKSQLQCNESEGE